MVICEEHIHFKDENCETCQQEWEEQTDLVDYSLSDWQYEVANGDTRLGYSEWLEHKIESNKKSSLMDK